MTARTYSSRRSLVVEAIATKLKEIDGTGDYLVNLFDNVQTRLLFPDEINDWPLVCVTAGAERREYQGGGVRDRYLIVTIRIYVREDEAISALDIILEDIESTIEGSTKIAYTDRQGQSQQLLNILVQSILTDEGTLEPLAVGEMVLEVQY